MNDSYMNMKKLFTCALAMMAMGAASAQTLQSVLESRYKEFACAIQNTRILETSIMA